MNKYLDEYYTNSITVRKIAESEGVSEHRIGYVFREQGTLNIHQLTN